MLKKNFLKQRWRRWKTRRPASHWRKQISLPYLCLVRTLMDQTGIATLLLHCWFKAAELNEHQVYLILVFTDEWSHCTQHAKPCWAWIIMLTESGTLHSVIYTKGTPAVQWTKSSVSLYQNTIGEKAGVLHPTKLLAARPLITFSSLFLQSARHLCCFPLARRDHSNH